MTVLYTIKKKKILTSFFEKFSVQFCVSKFEAVINDRNGVLFLGHPVNTAKKMLAFWCIIMKYFCLIKNCIWNVHLLYMYIFFFVHILLYIPDKKMKNCVHKILWHPQVPKKIIIL